MKRVGAALVLSVAVYGALASPPTVAAAASPPTDPAPFVDAFATWAESNGEPVTVPACHVPTEEEPAVVTCFGLAPGHVVVATVEVDDSGAPGRVVALAIPPAPDAPSTENGETAAPVPSDGPATSFGPGIQVVGSDVTPGTYTATVPADSDNCYWERLSGFSGELEDSIANDSVGVGELVTVEIEPTDAGFASNGCGTWTLLP